jgi:hypothetical protein
MVGNNGVGGFRQAFRQGAGGLDRREFLKAAGLGAAAVVAGWPDRLPAAKTTSRKRPNILLIITDQQHINSISSGGCKQIRTPAMDSLMKRGTAFALSHSVNSVHHWPIRSVRFAGSLKPRHRS